MQWWIETVGKLGPLAVAIAVVGVTLWQNEWQRRSARNQYAVTVRQLRLALFERRMEVLKAMVEVLRAVSANQRSLDGVSGSLFDSLIEGQTLFDVEIAQQLQAAWLDQVTLHNMSLNIVDVAGEGRFDEQARDRKNLQEKLFRELQDLQASMITATRIDGPLELNP